MRVTTISVVILVINIKQAGHLLSDLSRGILALIQMESLLLGRGEQPFAQNFLVRIVRQLQIVDAGVDRRVRAFAGVHLSDHGQPRVQIGQPARGQAAAAGRKLQERLALARVHSDQHVHEPQETGAGKAKATTLVKIRSSSSSCINQSTHLSFV